MNDIVVPKIPEYYYDKMCEMYIDSKDKISDELVNKLVDEVIRTNKLDKEFLIIDTAQHISHEKENMIELSIRIRDKSTQIK